MRMFFSCNDEHCEKLEKILKAHGLKSLFINNILNRLRDENGEFIEERIVAVLMNRFAMTFDGVSGSAGGEDRLGEIDRLSEIAKGFE